MEVFNLANKGIEELPAIGSDVSKVLQKHDSFCLYLTGDLGAGKTALSGQILYDIGLSRKVPVTSPTFTYMNEYQINEKWYAHLDLYRAGEEFSPEEIGLVDVRKFAGFLLEWPFQIPKHPFLKPTHRIDITFDESGSSRNYLFTALEE